MPNTERERITMSFTRELATKLAALPAGRVSGWVEDVLRPMFGLPPLVPPTQMHAERHGRKR